MFHINYDVGICLLCFGVLRKVECNVMQKKDVIVKEDHFDAMFDKPTKRRNEGFVHKVPGWMKGTFQLYMSHLDKCRDENSRLMSNMNDERGTRMQSMGEHALSKMAKELAVRLGKDPKNCADESFHRSADTQLAEAGTSVVGFQMAGNWKGVATPLEHVEHLNKS